jgi:hypothetical protein
LSWKVDKKLEDFDVGEKSSSHLKKLEDFDVGEKSSSHFVGIS